MAEPGERIFIFSRTQAKLKREVEGKHAKFGKVIVNGTSKMYTEIVRSMSNVKESDAEILIKGNIKKIKYFPPEG